MRPLLTEIREIRMRDLRTCLHMVRPHLDAYHEAVRILKANFTNVLERKAAIAIRDEFLQLAPAYLQDLVHGITFLADLTDGEECSDPESCGLTFTCIRCRVRELQNIQPVNAETEPTV